MGTRFAAVALDGAGGSCGASVGPAQCAGGESPRGVLSVSWARARSSSPGHVVLRPGRSRRGRRRPCGGPAFAQRLAPGARAGEDGTRQAPRAVSSRWTGALRRPLAVATAAMGLLALAVVAIPGTAHAHTAFATSAETHAHRAYISSTPRHGDGVYRTGERIEVTISFSKDVDSSEDGESTLPGRYVEIVVGTETRRARYLRGEGTLRLVYGYRVTADDRDDDGVSILQSVPSKYGYVDNLVYLAFERVNPKGNPNASIGPDFNAGNSAARDADSDHLVNSAGGRPRFLGRTISSYATVCVLWPGCRFLYTSRDELPYTGARTRNVGEPVAVVDGASLTGLTYSIENLGASTGRGTGRPEDGGWYSPTCRESNSCTDGVFSIDSATGQIGSIAGQTYRLSRYHVRVTAEDDNDASDSIDVVITRTRPNTDNQQSEVPDGDPVTAEFHGVPETHDGATAFTVELRFSEEFAVEAEALRGALEVNGGTLGEVSQVEEGKNLKWNLTVQPSSSDAAVTLRLAPSEDCSTDGAICTADGRALAEAIETEVPGREPTGVTSVSVTSDPGANGVWDTGETVTAQVVFSRQVSVNGPPGVGPTLGIQLDSTRREAAYTGGSGTDTLTFSHTVTAEDNGASSANIVTNGITTNDTIIGDNEGHVALLTFAGTEAPVSLPVLSVAYVADQEPPASHDGSTAFTFQFKFSEAPRNFKSATMREHSLVIMQGGSRLVPPVEAFRRIRNEGHHINLHWEVTVTPGGNGDISIALGPTGDCEETGAMCTADKRPLSNALPAATVSGPAEAAEASIADAEVVEADGAMLDFVVTLSRSQSETVTMRYGTRSKTAKAGLDYYGKKGTLTIPAGETAATVSVEVIDDGIDEDEEYMELWISRPSGGNVRIADNTARGTITNDDPLQKLWLSRFGRTVAIQTVDALEGRFAIGPDASPRMTMTVAGQSVDLARIGDEEALAETMTGLARAFGAPSANPGSGSGAGAGDDLFARHGFGEAGNGAGVSAPARSVTGRDLLLGSSFHFTTGEASGLGGAMTGWGKVLSGGSSSSLSGGLSFASETATGVLGMDWERDRLLVGVALSRSVEKGSASFGPTGMQYDIEGSLSMVTPYLRVRAGDRLSFWSAVGSGSGSMSLSQGSGWQTADVTMRLAAAGGRAELLRPGAAGGLALALKTDAFFVRSESARVSTLGVGNLAAATGDASRLRAVLEGSRAFALSAGGALAPSLEIGLRHDGGDAETGSGVEIGAGLTWSAPVAGLTSDLRLYGLAAHEAGGYDEWGASGSLRMVPDASGRGLSLSMTPSWGAQGQTGRLWNAAPGGLAGNGGGEQPGMRFDTELGYGLSLSDGLTGTPYAGFGFGEAGARDYRLGWRFASDRLRSLTLGIETTRREAANAPGSGSAEHGVTLRAGLRW